MNLSSSDTMPQFPGEFWTLLGVVFAFILLAVLAPVWCEKAQQAIVGPFSRLAARKTLVIGVLFFSIIGVRLAVLPLLPGPVPGIQDRKSTRLNSSHGYISYAVFCLKKKTLLISS